MPRRAAGVMPPASTRSRFPTGALATCCPTRPRSATYQRAVVTPLRAILRHAAKSGWCDAPGIDSVEIPDGRTRYLLPDEAEIGNLPACSCDATEGYSAPCREERLV